MIGRSATPEFPRFFRAWKPTAIGIEAQAHSSELLASFSGIGLYPVYQQKDQAGLQVVDRMGAICIPSIGPSESTRATPAFLRS